MFMANYLIVNANRSHDVYQASITANRRKLRQIALKNYAQITLKVTAEWPKSALCGPPPSSIGIHRLMYS